MKDINTVLPFGNTVAYITVKGSVLLEALEASTYSTPEELGAFPQVSGIKFTVDTTKKFDAGELYPGSTYYAPASINRVTIESINGKAFDPNATYVVVSNDFPAAGGDTYYAFSVSESVDTGAAMDTVVVDYITDVLKGTVTKADYGEPKGCITVVTAPESALPFTDVPATEWYYEYVLAAYTDKLMQGVSETTFEPYSDMTRAMLVTMLYRLEGSPEVEGKVTDVFTDCADGQWYSDAVLWANKNGVVEGRTDTTFDPNAKLTRQEMATILYRYSVYKGAAEVTKPEISFTDAASIASWAEAAVSYCAESGLMNGVDGNAFNPNGTANRAMGATVLTRLAA